MNEICVSSAVRLPEAGNNLIYEVARNYSPRAVTMTHRRFRACTPVIATAVQTELTLSAASAGN